MGTAERRAEVKSIARRCQPCNFLGGAEAWRNTPIGFERLSHSTISSGDSPFANRVESGKSDVEQGTSGTFES